MSGLIPIVILGILILVFSVRLLVQWSRRNSTQAISIEEYSQARAALDSAFEETATIRRIFAEEDRAFISRTGTRDVQRFFLDQRRSLAIKWLRGTRKQVARLMDLHFKLAGYTLEPSPRFEFRLTLTYWWFVTSCQALLILFWLRGPFVAARTVGYAVRKAENFCSMFSIRMEKTDPVKLGAAAPARFV